ncbi:MAG TPA: hypothetical protein VFL91_23115 [Thermomicrobiales bacterium]|nr:hypothetical protein [Thermomicrobiales bacterium]
MPGGRIIFLNGSSSAGKTSIATALQARLEEPYLLVGPDAIRPPLPRRYFDAATGYIPLDPPADAPARQAYYLTSGRDGGYDLHVGPAARRLVAGMHGAVAAFAAAGNNLIVDEVLYDPAYLREYVALLPAEDVLFVGLRCPLAVVEERERARGDRLVGHARGHHALVHAHGLYDLEVDTAANDPDRCADLILRRLRDGPPPTAFTRLRRRFAGDAAPAGEGPGG